MTNKISHLRSVSESTDSSTDTSQTSSSTLSDLHIPQSAINTRGKLPQERGSGKWRDPFFYLWAVIAFIVCYLGIATKFVLNAEKDLYNKISVNQSELVTKIDGNNVNLIKSISSNKEDLVKGISSTSKELEKKLDSKLEKIDKKLDKLFVPITRNIND